MERTDVKNNHTEEYSTGQIRCIEKSDPEYPQIMKQYSSMPAKLYVKGRLPKLAAKLVQESSTIKYIGMYVPTIQRLNTA